MKYIMLEVEEPIHLLLPVVFPNSFVHSEMAKHTIGMLHRVHKWDAKVRSAGEFNPIDCACSGESETLHLEAHPDDSQIILMHDYGFGYL